MLSRLAVRELYERSKAGNRWDKIGENVKIRFVELTKLADLIGRHKAVDAFVSQKVEAKLEADIEPQEITGRLQAGRARVAKMDESESGGESRR